jgi:hypothetical protein
LNRINDKDLVREEMTLRAKVAVRVRSKEMAQLNFEEFEAFWQSCQRAPIVRQATTTPIQHDLSLSGILDQYVVMANRFLAKGKISTADHDALVAAVAALKLILNRINDTDLVRQEMVNRAKVAVQRIQDQVTHLAQAFSR